MSEAEIIRHPGQVDQVKEDRVIVKIISSSGCASCYVKGACNIAEMEEKTIEVKTENVKQFKPGQHITVQMNLSTGTRAVLLGYVFPLILLLIVLITIYRLTGNDGMAGLGALFILLPYYLVLYLFRESLNRKTVFTIVEEEFTPFDPNCTSGG